MKLKSILLALLLVVVATTMAGCDIFSKKNSIVGTWEYVSGREIYYFSDARSFEINENGTIREFTYNESGTYTVTEDTLVVVADESSGIESFRFILDGDNLTLIDRDGDSAIYRRSSSAGNPNNNDENHNNSNENTNNQDSSIIGYWQRVSGRSLYYFADASTFEVSANGNIVEHEYEEKGTWTVSGNYLVVVAPSGTESFTYTVSADGNTLTLIDRAGDAAVYTRTNSGSINNNPTTKTELVGTWERSSGNWLYFFGDDTRITFGSNSNVSAGSNTGTYSASTNSLRVNYNNGSRNETFTYSINGNTLTITDSANDSSIYTRVS